MAMMNILAKITPGLVLATVMVIVSGSCMAEPADLRLAWIIRLPVTISDVLVADAGNATLHRFSNAGDATRWRDAHYMSIGENGIRKQRAWDRKSPLGTYFVTEEIDTTPLHEKYGVAAFSLDYPNTWDRLHDRTGYGIWLHGVDSRSPQRPPLDTDGCLALPNEALLAVKQAVATLSTPVLVAEGLEWVDAATLESIRLGLEDVMEQWRSSLVDGDLLRYLALYGDNFQHGGMDKAAWAAYRLQVFETRRITSLELHDLLLLADPAEPDLYLSRFRQTMTVDGNEVRFTKRIYWRRLTDGRWHIVAEGTG